MMDHQSAGTVALAGNENKKFDNRSVSIDCGNFATLLKSTLILIIV